MAEQSPEPIHPTEEQHGPVATEAMSPSPSPMVRAVAAEAAISTLGPPKTTLAITTSLSPTNASANGPPHSHPSAGADGKQPIHIKRLSPIEAIIMHKDLQRKNINDHDVLIRELEYILTKAVGKGPSLCRMDLYGPDTLNVSRSPAALEYLRGLGFVQVAEEKGRRDSNAAPAVPAAAAESTPTVPHGPIKHYLQLANVPQENSSDWQIFRSDVGKALEELRKAKTVDAGQLTIMLHRFIFFQAMSTEYRIELVVKEGSHGSSGADANIAEGEVDKDIAAALAAARIAAGVTASVNGPGRSAKAKEGAADKAPGEHLEETYTTDFFGLDDATPLAAPSPPTSHPTENTSPSGVPPPALTLYQNMMATFQLARIAGPSTIDVLVYRKRTLRGDKPKAVGTLFFDNSACVRKEIDLKDPRAPGGLPIGRITVEVQSLRLRHAALEEASMPSKSGLGVSGHSASPVDTAKNAQPVTNATKEKDEEKAPGSTSPATHALWIDQQAIITAAATAKATTDYAHATYDADDYF